jgi:hypothetical protein
MLSGNSVLFRATHATMEIEEHALQGGQYEFH